MPEIVPHRSINKSSTNCNITNTTRFPYCSPAKISKPNDSRHRLSSLQVREFLFKVTELVKVAHV